jgi:hypothetical protein
MLPPTLLAMKETTSFSDSLAHVKMQYTTQERIRAGEPEWYHASQQQFKKATANIS